MVGAFEQIALALMIFAIKLGMGATIRASGLRAALANPAPLLIGLLCQYGLMPAIALGLAIAFQLPAAVALSLVMVGATPGGTTSNLYTYFARGDVALSVSMTVASTLAAVVLMPLMIFFYGGRYTSADLQAPFSNIAVTLALVIIPVAIGMVVLSRSERAARTLERLGGLVGVILIGILILKFLLQNRDMFLGTASGIILSSILLGLLGYLLGYLLARLFGLSAKICRTISLETGLQNTPLTIAVIVLSFPAGVEQDEMLVLPTFYAFFVVVTAAIVAFGFRAANRDEATL